MILSAAALYLTVAQTYWLNYAYEEGSRYGIGKTFMAVVLVESSACVNRRGDDGNSLGCSMLMVQTARQTCRCNINPGVLEKNNAINLKIGAQFLDACFSRFWPDRARAISCFNRGIPAASKATASQILKSRYVARVLRAEKMLEQVKMNND